MATTPDRTGLPTADQQKQIAAWLRQFDFSGAEIRTLTTSMNGLAVVSCMMRAVARVVLDERGRANGAFN